MSNNCALSENVRYCRIIRTLVDLLLPGLDDLEAGVLFSYNNSIITDILNSNNIKYCCQFNL